ncbi:MAG: tryptophan--tRNA ligase [Chloroflexi bacterium]|nr:tryptophan--tRNA ligase [Chloroflexota bacterium]
MGRETAGTGTDGAPRVLSGITPTGRLHLGNYLGALVHWTRLQHMYESFFSIADLHAITTRQDPRILRATIREMAAVLIAAGIDPQRAVLFVQSDVPAHTELAWILLCLAPMGRLERMTQFKEKAGAERESASAGLFGYPVLQAADILLYSGWPPRPVLVPVGADQRQHLELARDLAARFNHRFGRVFAVPEALIAEAGARVMGLQNPERKMSKSARTPADTLYLLDSPAEIRRKLARAVTGPGRAVQFDPSQPGLYNLLTIYQVLSGASPPAIEEHFRGRGYAELKGELADLVIATLQPIQERYRRVSQDPGYLDSVLAAGAERARAAAHVILAAAKEAVGLGAGTAGSGRGEDKQAGDGRDRDHD